MTLMSSRRATLNQAVLTRYAKGLLAAGVSDFRFVVHPDGTHEIIAGKTKGARLAGPDPDELFNE